MDTIIKSLINFYFIFSLIYYKIYIRTKQPGKNHAYRKSKNFPITEKEIIT